MDTRNVRRYQFGLWIPLEYDRRQFFEGGQFKVTYSKIRTSTENKNVKNG